MLCLLTRPQGKNHDLKKTLEKRGHDVIVSPLLQYKPLALDLTSFQRPVAWIITSGYALEALVNMDPACEAPVFAVGPKTAMACQRKGFQVILHGNNSAKRLRDSIETWYHHHACTGPLGYVSGVHQSFPMSASLQQAHVSCETHVVYDMVPMKTLHPKAEKAFLAGSLGGVFTFSLRTLLVLCACLRKLGSLSSLPPLVCPQSVPEADFFQKKIFFQDPTKDMARCIETLEALYDRRNA